jgi:hypothetical protein
MKTITLEGFVENGQIRLPATARLPEKARVFVVIPGVEASPAIYIGSPRLAHPEQAGLFVKEVIEEEDRDAAL